MTDQSSPEATSPFVVVGVPAAFAAVATVVKVPVVSATARATAVILERGGVRTSFLYLGEGPDGGERDRA
ncbi:hypothetical protein CPE01_27480 [Cellulomonas persica]|uniref:Uncharacterized protein n=1 Tax=Cellulomonas persica TaxID=76861 RepID=A0A510V1N8_9CELL|nr:hypothetical protein CPE01_27480 [Cellulomonas persica]